MKKTLGIWILVFSNLSSVFGQPKDSLFHSTFERQAFQTRDPLELLVAADPDATLNKYTAYLQDIDALTDQLLRKRHKLSDEELLKKLFYKVHQKKLKWYENYVTINDLLDNGSYDCLTGTAFYALVLDKLKIPYTIHEFDFHVLLVVHLAGKQVLFESTDPYGGFMADQNMIDAHLKKYLSDNANEVGRKTVIGNRAKVTQGSEVNERILLEELVGLQYYNIAINLYNQGKLYQSRTYIDKAWALYPSTRITDTKSYFYATMPVTFLKQQIKW